jgi:hypothetical protein
MTWSAAFALLSAAIWLSSALVPIPKTAWLVSGVGAGRPSPELDGILGRLRRQSYFNVAAAASMAVSAWLQVC